MLKNQNENVTKILVSQEEIEQITSRLAAQISKDYENDPRQVVLLIIL